MYFLPLQNIASVLFLIRITLLDIGLSNMVRTLLGHIIYVNSLNLLRMVGLTRCKQPLSTNEN